MRRPSGTAITQAPMRTQSGRVPRGGLRAGGGGSDPAGGCARGAATSSVAVTEGGVADDLAAGLDAAFAVLDDGRAGATLDGFVRVSQTARDTEAA